MTTGRCAYGNECKFNHITKEKWEAQKKKEEAAKKASAAAAEIAQE